jgi:hypothetical protein
MTETPTDYLMSPSRLWDVAAAPAQWALRPRGSPAPYRVVALTGVDKQRRAVLADGLNLKPTLSLVGCDAASQDAAASQPAILRPRKACARADAEARRRRMK